MSFWIKISFLEEALPTIFKFRTGIGLQWMGPLVALFFLLSLPTIILGNFDPFLKSLRKTAKKMKEEKKASKEKGD